MSDTRGILKNTTLIQVNVNPVLYKIPQFPVLAGIKYSEHLWQKMRDVRQAVNGGKPFPKHEKQPIYSSFRPEYLFDAQSSSIHFAWVVRDTKTKTAILEIGGMHADIDFAETQQSNGRETELFVPADWAQRVAELVAQGFCRFIASSRVVLRDGRTAGYSMRPVVQSSRKFALAA